LRTNTSEFGDLSPSRKAFCWCSLRAGKNASQPGKSAAGRRKLFPSKEPSGRWGRVARETQIRVQYHQITVLVKRGPSAEKSQLTFGVSRGHAEHRAGRSRVWLILKTWTSSRYPYFLKSVLIMAERGVLYSAACLFFVPVEKSTGEGDFRGKLPLKSRTEEGPLHEKYPHVFFYKVRQTRGLSREDFRHVFLQKRGEKGAVGRGGRLLS